MSNKISLLYYIDSKTNNLYTRELYSSLISLFITHPNLDNFSLFIAGPNENFILKLKDFLISVIPFRCEINIFITPTQEGKSPFYQKILAIKSFYASMTKEVLII